MTQASDRPLRVGVLVVAEGPVLVPVGVADFLRKSAALSPARRVEVSLIAVGPTREIRGTSGITLGCDLALHEAEPPDLVVVPALDPEALDEVGAHPAVGWVRRAWDAGVDVCSVCTGAFVLAEAGLLAGRPATTHWAFQDLLHARHPEVHIEPQAVLVDAGRVITSGGATSFLNLALLLVERLLGPETARVASRMFLVDVNKPPQSAYATLHTHKTHDDAQILQVQQRLESDPGAPWAVESLAVDHGMSPRTFDRRFRRATGTTPWAYIQRVRVEAARRELEGTDEPVTAIAGRLRYADVATFRKVFVRITGLTPAEYRARYGRRTAPGWVDAPRA